MRFHAKVSRYVKKSGLLRESLRYFALFVTKVVVFWQRSVLRGELLSTCIMP